MALLLVAGGAFIALGGSDLTITEVDTPDPWYYGQNGTITVSLQNSADAIQSVRMIAKLGPETSVTKQAMLSTGSSSLSLSLPGTRIGNQTVDLQLYRDDQLVIERELSTSITGPTVEDIGLPETVIDGAVPTFNPRISYGAADPLMATVQTTVNGQTDSAMVALHADANITGTVADRLNEGDNTVTVSVLYDGTVLSEQTRTITVAQPQVEVDLRTQQRTGTFIDLEDDTQREFQYVTYNYTITNTGDVRAPGVSYRLSAHPPSGDFYEFVSAETDLGPDAVRWFRNDDVLDARLDDAFTGAYGQDVGRPGPDRNSLYLAMWDESAYEKPDNAWVGGSQLQQALLDPQGRLLRGVTDTTFFDSDWTGGSEKQFILKLEVTVPGQESPIVQEETVTLEVPATI